MLPVNKMATETWNLQENGGHTSLEQVLDGTPKCLLNGQKGYFVMKLSEKMKQDFRNISQSWK